MTPDQLPWQQRLIPSLTAITCIAIPLSPIAKSPSLWILLALFLGLLASQRSATSTALKALWPMAWPVLAALTCSLLWSHYAWQHGTAYRDVFKAWLAAAAVAVLWSKLSSEQFVQVKRLLAAMIISLGAVSAYLLWHTPASNTAIIWLDSVENMNLWGLAFGLTISTAVAIALCSRARLAAPLLVASALGYAWLALYYPSRGGLLAVALCTALLIMLRFQLLPRWLLMLGLATGVILGSVSVLLIEASGYLSVDRINAISAGRYPIYSSAWQQWLEAPWFGWGVKGIKLHISPIITAMSPGLTVTALHNVLLEMLFSMGLVGTAFIGFAVTRLLWRAFSQAQTYHTRLPGLLAVGLSGTLLLHGVTDLSIYRPYFWLILFTSWSLVATGGRTLSSNTRSTC